MQNACIHLLAASSILLAVNSAQAQVTCSIGPRVGLTVATAAYNTFSGAYRTGYRAGLEAGLVGQLGIAHVAVQPAVLYSQKGFTIHDTQQNSLGSTQRDDTYRLHYLTTPVNLVFTSHADGQGMQLALGGYLSWLLGGNFQTQVTHTSSGYYTYGSTGVVGPPPPVTIYAEAGNVASEYSTTTPTFYSNKTDAGLQASLGYRYGGALVQAGYSLGLRNLADAQSTVTYYNRAFQVSLSYLFGIKS